MEKCNQKGGKTSERPWRLQRSERPPRSQGSSVDFSNIHFPPECHNSEIPYSELIAVQQRMNLGVRKIIFWYISKVDLVSRRMSDTQEGGEESVVEWVFRC